MSFDLNNPPGYFDSGGGPSGMRDRGFFDLNMEPDSSAAEQGGPDSSAGEQGGPDLQHEDNEASGAHRCYSLLQ